MFYCTYFGILFDNLFISTSIFFTLPVILFAIQFVQSASNEMAVGDTVHHNTFYWFYHRYTNLFSVLFKNSWVYLMRLSRFLYLGVVNKSRAGLVCERYLKYTFFTQSKKNIKMALHMITRYIKCAKIDAINYRLNFSSLLDGTKIV